MTTGNARTSPSLALARRIAAVGLLAGGPALLASGPAATTERANVDSAGREETDGSGLDTNPLSTPPGGHQ